MASNEKHDIKQSLQTIRIQLFKVKTTYGFSHKNCQRTTGGN